MAKAKQREAWNHTASLLSFLYNALRSEKSAPTTAIDFHPLIDAKECEEYYNKDSKGGLERLARELQMMGHKGEMHVCRSN